MKRTLFQRLDLWARGMIPAGMAALAVIISVLPVPVPGFAALSPSLGLIAVYHWSIYRPDLMSDVAVALVGLLADFLEGTGPGINMVTLLLVRAVILAQRRLFLSLNFVFAWLGFAVLAGGAGLLLWLLHSAYRGALIETRGVFFQYLMTVAAYPFLSWIFARTQHALLR